MYLYLTPRPSLSRSLSLSSHYSPARCDSHEPLPIDIIAGGASRHSNEPLVYPFSSVWIRSYNYSVSLVERLLPGRYINTMCTYRFSVDANLSLAPYHYLCSIPVYFSVDLTSPLVQSSITTSVQV